MHRETALAPSWELEADAQLDETASHEALPRYDRPSITEANLDEPGESVQPIYANLIEFPREMIATRRVRPRRAEGPLAETESAPQLSIFEVDPAAISTQPAPATTDLPTPPEWMRTDWSDMTLEPLPPSMNSAPLPSSMNFGALPANLEAQPSAMSFAAQLPALDLEAQPREQFVDELLEEPELEAAPAIELAPMSRRLLATFVDCTLIAAALVAVAVLAAYNTSELPTLARATPGMRYAGIELNTFSGYTTSRGQRCGRLLALLLSVLPLGLGMVWALFDDGGLTWHDRLSKTYLRKR